VGFQAEVGFRAAVGFQMEVPPVLVEVRWLRWASSVSAVSLLCHVCMEGSRPYDFYKPLQGVFPSQPTPFYLQETQLLASSLLRLRHEVFELGVVFPFLRSAETPVWPFWPYSRQGACRTVLAVPEVLLPP